MSLLSIVIPARNESLSIAGAIDAGVRTAIVGVAPTGGQIVAEWLPLLVELARAGIDIAAGMHSRLKDIPELVAAAEEGNARLIDVRVLDHLVVTAAERFSLGRHGQEAVT